VIEGIIYDQDMPNGLGVDERYYSCAFESAEGSALTIGGKSLSVLAVNCVFKEVHFSGLLSGVDFYGCFFQDCTFDGADLSVTRFHACTLVGCSLEGATVGALDLGASYVVGLGVYLLGSADNRGFCPFAVRDVQTGAVTLIDTEWGTIGLAEAAKAYDPERYFGRRSLAARYGRELNALIGMERAGKLDWLASVRA